MHCRCFPHHIRRGKVSDQTLFADEHLSTNHCTEGVASCHVAIERSHRQAGQLRRAASEADLGNDHDLMSPRRYGDMQTFVQKLTDMGHERVELIDTTDGSFMTPKEAGPLMLRGSTLLVGRK